MFCTQVTLHPDYMPESEDRRGRRIDAELRTDSLGDPMLTVSLEERTIDGYTRVSFYGTPAAVLAELDDVRAAIDAALARFGSPLPEPVGNAA